MSPQACAEYISGGGEISKSVINGLLGTQATNLADLARIRDFLLTVFSDVDAESLQSSPTRHLANTLNTLIAKTRQPPFNPLAMQNLRPPFEHLLLTTRDDTASMTLSLSTGILMPVTTYKIFPVSAQLEIKLSAYPEVPDGLDALTDARRLFFGGHVVAHSERLTGTLSEKDRTVCVWVGIVHRGPPRPWGVRITQIEGDYSPLVNSPVFISEPVI